ncbi:MAG: hypothetical protein D6677_01685 [Calditrichaeota bacterium]|nr:MAG: hypothetical protein D6677_01685 [Calditrichota bacterium]
MNAKHAVAIFGGAVAGSEAAANLARDDVVVFVFEQNALPYGKIEYGLPMWHIKLRDKYERLIDDKLNRPNIHFIPGVKLGREIDFSELVEKWPFAAVLLATGAWKDRPLPVPGIDAYIGKGLYYQNPFVQWFNHKHRSDYDGPQCHVEEGAIIVGGGLASIDVAKIHMMENFLKKVRSMGLEMDIFTLERLGLPKAAEKLGISLSQLDIQPCTIYYRRRLVDMPLSPNPPRDEPSLWEKTHQVRLKILTLAREKYLFNVEELHSPVDMHVQDGRLKGLVFRRNQPGENGPVGIPGSAYVVPAPLVISSIGSIPEKIPGVPCLGDRLCVEDPQTGKLNGLGHVYALGNAITGKGNIKESLHHGRKVSEHIVRAYLGLEETPDAPEEIKTPVKGQVDNLMKDIQRQPELEPEQYAGLCRLIEETCPDRPGMGSDRPGVDYVKWVAEHKPERLEDQLKEHHGR